MFSPPPLPISVLQMGSPPLDALMAWMYVLLPEAPIVNTLPSATVTDENPSPTPLAFQSSSGPSLGHSFSRPLSGERLSRLGPRYVGHDGPAGSAGWAGRTDARASRPTAGRKNRVIGKGSSE